MDTMNLTDRQYRILELSAWMNAEKDIANALDLSVHTVNTVKRVIRKKTGKTMQQLAFEYFDIDPAKNPILNYDCRPRLSTGKRIGAVFMAGLMLVQILIPGNNMIRQQRARAAYHTRIVISGRNRSEFMYDGECPGLEPLPS